MSSDVRNDEASTSDEDSIVNRVVQSLKKLGLITVIYVWAYYGFSIAWIYLGAIIYFLTKKWSEESREKWGIARAMALGYEKDFLVKKLHYLPSWVNFPDIERSEWLNRIIRQTWPRVNHYTRDLLLKVIEPKIQTYMKGFKFDKVVLGNVPFRIDGIKVYEEQDITRDKIVMDIDISYAGDCQIVFQVTGFKGGIENFMLRGRLRVVMKPLISKMPLIGGLQVYFLREPEIDFDLTGVTSVLSVPGLRNVILNSVTDTINSMLLFPNIYPIQLSSEIPISEITIFEPEGVLRVHVIEAKHLMKKDINLIGTGKSDPYAVLTVGPKSYKTKTIDNTLDPKWDEWVEFEVEANSELKIHVWDHDEGSKDETLGTAKISIMSIAKAGHEEMLIPLQGVMHGMIRLDLTWLSLSPNSADLDSVLTEAHLNNKLHTALLIFYIDSAKNLPEVKSSTPPDAYVKVQVEKSVHETDVVKQTRNPVFERNFIFMVVNPKTAVINLKILDKKSGNEIGTLAYDVNNLLEQRNMQLKNHPFILRKSGSDTSMMCTIKLRAFKSDYKKPEPHQEAAEPNNVDNVNQIRRLTKQESAISSISAKSIKSETMDDEGEISESADTDSVSINSLEFKRDSVSSNLVNFRGLDGGLGSVELTLRYSLHGATLNVVVNQVRNIPLKNPTNIPDPYVKLYLLPNRRKETKRKTMAVKDNCNPVFDEHFQFSGISVTDLSSIQLEVTVLTQKKVFGNTILGQVIINLGELGSLTQPLNKWFDLE